MHGNDSNSIARMGYAKNGLTVAQNDTTEQFSLETGKTYYFNLAPLVMPGKGTLNNNFQIRACNGCHSPMSERLMPIGKNNDRH